MGYKVILTDECLADLQELVSFIAQDNPQAAERFGHALIDQALSVSEMPERGRSVPEADDPTIREITHRSYRIMYYVDKAHGEVYILRFWHAARGEPEI